MERRLPVILLNRVDLPKFGRPSMTTPGRYSPEEEDLLIGLCPHPNLSWRSSVYKHDGQSLRSARAPVRPRRQQIPAPHRSSTVCSKVCSEDCSNGLRAVLNIWISVDWASAKQRSTLSKWSDTGSWQQTWRYRLVAASRVADFLERLTSSPTTVRRWFSLRLRPGLLIDFLRPRAMWI